MSKVNSKLYSDWLIVIPARFGSTRLPGKMILDLCGKPLVVRVYENLQSLLEKGFHIIVATDSKEISDICFLYKVPFFLTQKNHPSGTDRCCEVAQIYEIPYIINVQGDEPFLDPKDLLKITEKREYLDQGALLTLASRSNDHIDREALSTVKLIPEGFQAKDFMRVLPSEFGPSFYHHHGIYAFHQKTLERFCALEQSPREKELKLEQLRALDNGIKIFFVETAHPSFGIDTRQDLLRARDFFLQKERNS